MMDDETKAAVMKVLDGGRFILGEEVGKFETEFAAYCGANNCVGVNSGTSALWLALKAHGVGAAQFDEVITSPISFYSTAVAAIYCGARPVFVDVDPKTLTLNPNLLEAAITQKTKAIVPVHLHGHPCDMDPIIEIASKHGIPVIEDACEAHGSLYKGMKIGSSPSTTSCFSFYPSKNIMAAGDGGCVVTYDFKVAERIRILRDHGRDSTGTFKEIGYNERLGEIGAAVLRVQLKHLDKWNARRRLLAQMYRAQIDSPEVMHPFEPEYALSNYYVYVVRLKRRNELMARLKENNIEYAVHFEPVIYQEAPIMPYLTVVRVSCPVAEAAVKEILTLPMNAALTDEEIERVCEVVNG